MAQDLFDVECPHRPQFRQDDQVRRLRHPGQHVRDPRHPVGDVLVVLDPQLSERDRDHGASVAHGADTVSFISYAGGTATAVPVSGTFYSYTLDGFIALDADGSRGYVTDHNVGTVSLVAFDGTTATVTTVNLNDSPHSVATSADGTKAFVVAHGGLYVVDTSGPTPVLSIVNIPANNNASDYEQVSVSPDGSRVFVSDISGNLTILDATTPIQV